MKIFRKIGESLESLGQISSVNLEFSLYFFFLLFIDFSLLPYFKTFIINK